MVTDSDATENVIEQGQALVRAIAALNTIEPSNYLEGHIANLLAAAYERRLREIIDTVPAEVGEEILSGGDEETSSNTRTRTPGR
jgi:hypothetical protein